MSDCIIELNSTCNMSVKVLEFMTIFFGKNITSEETVHLNNEFE